MDKFEKEAENIVKKFVDPFIASGHANSLYSDVCGDAYRAISEALQRAYLGGLEDAARVALTTRIFSTTLDKKDRRVVLVSQQEIVDSIRGMMK